MWGTGTTDPRFLFLQNPLPQLGPRLGDLRLLPTNYNGLLSSVLGSKYEGKSLREEVISSSALVLM